MNKNKIGCKDMKRELEIGDKIHACGYTFEINKILSQDFYVDNFYKHHEENGTLENWMEDRSCIDIEFKDPKGSYHHWKSNQDGGYIIYKEDKRS